MAQATTKKKTTARPKSAASFAEFTLFAPEAHEIYVAGDFDNWDAAKCPMKKTKDGIWKKKVKLAPGRYEYRFLVDGQWCSDPENISRQPNPFGSENSVLIVI